VVITCLGWYSQRHGRGSEVERTEEVSWLGGWAMLLEVSLSWEESSKEWLNKEGDDEEGGKGDGVRRRWDGAPGWLHPSDQTGFLNAGHSSHLLSGLEEGVVGDTPQSSPRCVRPLSRRETCSRVSSSDQPVHVPNLRLQPLET